YAIPAETVVKNLNDLNTHGYVRGRADLGIEVKETIVRVSYREYYVLLQVEKMNPQGSAAESELKVGDILIQCDGKTIDSFSTLSQYLLTKYSVGDKVTLTVRRPTIELTSANLDEYLKAAEIIDIEITFKDFDPNA
ncbi:MAG: PDZ domain-containing protein, partial [Clostridia bacterium]|nr:PDZ domain-containing protein [Clostridia bacterium]